MTKSNVCTCRRIAVLFAIIFLLFVAFKIFLPTSNSLDDSVFFKSERNWTDAQKLSYAQFKENTKYLATIDPPLQFDVFLRVWFEKADFDVENAEKLLNENVKWKVENNITTIHDEDWSDFALEYDLSREDSAGRPVLFVNYGQWNLRQIINNGKKDRLFRFAIKVIDEIANAVFRKYENGEDVTEYVLLAELDDFGFYKGMCFDCMGMYVSFVSVVEERYPFVYKIVTINTPGIFSLVVNLIKPLLSAKNQNNLHILGGPEEYQPFLSKLGISTSGNFDDER